MIPRGPRSLVHHSTVAVAILATSLAHALQTAPEEQDEATRGTGVVAKGAPQKVAAEYTNRHALLIGISDYADPNFQDLAYADDDARGMAEVLTQQLGFPKENVRLLLDKDASQAAIREALQDWSADKKRIGENDLYVLFYAGHGWTRDVNGKNVGLIVPQDARMKSAEEPVWSSFVPMSELELASETIPARHAAFILDCCFSGLVFATHRAGPALAGMSNRARQVLTAGNDEQQVQDGGTGSHSVFTAALIDGLRGNADGNGDAVIGFGELFQYVGNRVQDESSRPQTPAQAMLPDHNGGAVAFYAPGTMNQAKPPEDRLALLQSTAAQSTRELRALADLSRSSDLLDEYDQLWPLLPEEIGRMRTWIGRCDELLQRLRDHEDLETKQRQRIFLEQSVAKLLPEDATQPRWSEASEFDVWQHKSWTKLVAQIRELSQLKPSVLARIEQAGWLEEYSLGVHARAWAACIQSVESLPAYQGLRLTPQVGLVPKRMNPESGLWEFHHVQSSWTTDTCVQDTTRSPDLSSSLVFALIPAGEFRRHPGWDGRLPQAIRPLPNEIPPFFLSTRQMNVRQASAFCGSRPQS
ncbi:MAG: caspase family protein [Planctomycetes bacterium]|nr:caspase family protein [Planctomycetota bacterium]